MIAALQPFIERGVPVVGDLTAVRGDERRAEVVERGGVWRDRADHVAQHGRGLLEWTEAA